MDIKEYLKQIGAQGGKNTAKKHGKDHYIRISKLGVARRKENAKRKALTRSETEEGREF